MNAIEGAEVTRELQPEGKRTMKPLSSLLPLKSLAAAGICLAAPVFAQSLTPNRLGTPDDGLICRSGYTGAFSGSFKCSKAKTISITLECANPTFPTYVIRPAGSAGTPQGRDICTRNSVSVGSTDSVVNLVQGQDYVLAAVNPATLTSRTTNLDEEEAKALGLDAAKDVDTIAAEPVVQPDAGAGSRDRANVQVTHYTFAIPTGGAITALRN
jgi:hypothetical protein